MFHVLERRSTAQYHNYNNNDETFIETYISLCIQGHNTDRGIYTGRLLLGGWVGLRLLGNLGVVFFGMIWYLHGLVWSRLVSFGPDRFLFSVLFWRAGA